MTDTAIQTTKPAQLGPMELMQQALSRGTSPEVIRELVALQQSVERFAWEREERQAKIDFDNALNDCQSQIERVVPNRDRENGIKWADYIAIDKAVRPVYLPAGFSIGFSEAEPDAAGRRMCATLSRGGVHRDYFSRLVPAGNSKMSAADAEASASSRAMRYLLLKIFNIAVGIDKDEKAPFADGKQPGKLDERDNLTHYDAIKNAANMADLQKFYLAALGAAEAIGDAGSIKDFIAAKTARMGELQKGNR
jgi:hypothetical protein